MRKPTRRISGEGSIAGEGGDARSLRFRRGRDDGMDRRNTREARETPAGGGEHQRDAREGQARLVGVAERFVVASMPGNAGGAKGPQFKDNAVNNKGPGYWRKPMTRKCSSVVEGVARDREESLAIRGFRVPKRDTTGMTSSLSESRMREIRPSGSMSGE